MADTESLADWLRGEPELAGRVRLTGQEPKQGELGSALDTLTVAFGAGGTGTVLVASLRTWLAQPRRSDVRLKIQRENGATVEIDAKRVKTGDLEQLLREALGHDQDSGVRE
ncbi:effector-associated constant component EACC1 [Streptomyces mirabilis]